MIGLLRRIRYRSRVEPWWESQPTFEFAGKVFKLFVSNHNCGWPPARMTERAVELPLADRWLESVDAARVMEIGAVTPYYWPRRVPHVVDPYDPHPLVTTKASLFDVDLSAGPVLSISTPLPEKLKQVQKLMEKGDYRACKIYETIGTYLGYAIWSFTDFYDLENVLILGRVTSGPGGDIIIAGAKDVLKVEFPELTGKIAFHIPDERDKRHGQAVAAASLPKVG